MLALDAGGSVLVASCAAAAVLVLGAGGVEVAAGPCAAVADTEVAKVAGVAGNGPEDPSAVVDAGQAFAGEGSGSIDPFAAGKLKTVVAVEQQKILDSCRLLLLRRRNTGLGLHLGCILAGVGGEPDHAKLRVEAVGQP